MGVFSDQGHTGHERVVFHEDRRSGLRAIVASTRPHWARPWAARGSTRTRPKRRHSRTCST